MRSPVHAGNCFLFLVALMLQIPAFAQETAAGKLIEQANQAYHEADFQTAIRTYHQIEAQGYVSAELFYNLGNAYFKADSIGRAILNYERALRLSPSDEDIRFNLEVARLRTVDKIEPDQRFFLARWLGNGLKRGIAVPWALLSPALFVIALGFLLFYFFSTRSSAKKIHFAVFGFTALFSAVTLLLASQQAKILHNNTEGIVLLPSVTVKSSPGTTGKDFVILHEGTKISVEATENEWVKIRIPDGNIGWVPIGAVERI